MTQRLFSQLVVVLAFMSACVSAHATNGFAGSYQAAYTNTTIAAEIVENQNLIRGNFVMDGEQYKIIATRNQNTFRGKILDERKGKFYDVASRLTGNQLHFAIVFPELGNKVVELQLTKAGNIARSAGSQPTTQAARNNKEKSPRLVGTWRYTEVLSSGKGGNYASLATDYFLQFKPNGECLSWSGSSAGGSSNVSIESRGNGSVTREEWYTEGKQVIFVNPQTQEEVSRTFFAEESRMMLKGSSSKVYQRVQ